jgi:uncharacterized protein YbcI
VTDVSAQSVQTADVGGSTLAEVSRRLVQLHKEGFGRGPTKARSFVSGDVLVCLLEGGYLPMERTLREHGRGDLVEDQREAMQHVMEERFVGTIEEVTGRRVVSFMSASDEHHELSTEIFVFEPDEPIGT